MLSIIIPSFRDPRILRAIASVRRFDDTDETQIVVVDGGSGGELTETIKASLLPRDKFIQEPDDGIFDALNKGLQRADGDCIGWLGSDDVYADQVKATDVLRGLEQHDVFLGGTAMVDKTRIKRVFWLPADPVRAAFLGLHNPHFSTFGRAALFRSSSFDVTMPIADIGYFLDVFSRTPSVLVDRRIVTLQQVGGFSNGTIGKSVKFNLMTFSLYRRHLSAPRAAVATVMKIVPKLASAAFHAVNPKFVDDDLLSPSLDSR